MIRVITTGGTIAESPGKDDRFHLSGQQLIAELSGARLSDGVEVVDLLDVPSTFIKIEDMLRIAAVADEARADSRVDGVVVTHGTATMEETAFLVDLVVATGKPIVFTGAMLMPGRPGYDGLANLSDAIATAASNESWGKGVLVLMNGEIHAARDVVKTHATALNAFRSPESGPVGRIANGETVYTRMPSKHDSIAPCQPVAEVCLMTCYAGMSAGILQAYQSLRPGGLIVAGMSSGAVPPWLTEPLESMVKSGVAVAVSTRCAEGTVLTSKPDRRTVSGYPEDLFARGMIPTTLPGIKARIKLSLLLSAGGSGDELRRLMLR